MGDATTTGAAEAAAKLKDEGTAAYKAKDYAGAVARYGEAIKLAPSAVLYLNRAAANMALLQYPEAVEDCAQAVRLEDGNVKAYMRGAKAQLLQGNIAESFALITRATLKDPKDEDARADCRVVDTARRRLATANEALNSREFDKALSLLNMLADTCPGSLELRLKRLEAQIGLRRIEAASTAATALLEAHGKTDPRLLVYRARILVLQGNTALATKYLQEALRQDPDFAPASKVLKSLRKAEALKATGNEKFKAGEWAAADKAYTECLELDPLNENANFNAKLYANRAASKLKQSKSEAAFFDASQAIELDPSLVNGYKRRAQACVAIGDKEKLETAVRDLTKAKDLASGDGSNSSSTEAAELGRSLQEARAALKKAKRKDYYKILEIERGAEEEDIKKAYRKAALKWHPDRHSASENPADTVKAEAMFKDVGEAYAILSDPAKRRQFDAGASFDGSGDVEMDMDDHRGHGHSHGGNPFGGMGGMGGGGIPPELFEHIFASMNGGGMGGGGGGRRR